jgi:hypothetical protein
VAWLLDGIQSAQLEVTVRTPTLALTKRLVEPVEHRVTVLPARTLVEVFDPLARSPITGPAVVVQEPVVLEATHRLQEQLRQKQMLVPVVAALLQQSQALQFVTQPVVVAACTGMAETLEPAVRALRQTQLLVEQVAKVA